MTLALPPRHMSRLPLSPLFLVSIWLRCVLYTCGIILLADPVNNDVSGGPVSRPPLHQFICRTTTKKRSIGQTALHTQCIHPINREDISLENIYFSSSSIIFVKTLRPRERKRNRQQTKKQTFFDSRTGLPQAFTQDELHLNRLFCESSLMMRSGPTAILVAS